VGQGRSIFPRRAVIKGGAAAGAAGVLGGLAPSASASPETHAGDDVHRTLRTRVESTPLVDTHEHLLEEEVRLSGTSGRIRADDWSFLVAHYLDSDMRTCGMPEEEHAAFFSPETDPIRKWQLLEPYWPRIRHTGYAQAVEIAARRLYGVEGLSRDTITRVQEGYRTGIRPGFYKRVLEDVALLESCQVNSLEAPFSESRQPTLLMQDISILGMHMGPDVEAYARKPGIRVRDLADWHRVIDWWFETYGPYAVAVKTQAAYSRNIDFADVPPEDVEAAFKRVLGEEPVDPAEEKLLQDHLFWYCARKATAHGLPVKVHTGYYAGDNYMPMGRLQGNVDAASDLCRMAPDTRFVFMHINYPFYEDLIAVAKHYTNCYIDMCWAWILSPVAAARFLMQYLVTAPANKVLTFGGDYIPVEPVVGHATLARRGIAVSLTQLVDEGWLDLEAALDVVDPIMRGNARSLFDLEHKTERLKKAPWLEA
jgi:predicted TIM-barrel fold metal-dependent hydrolase